MVDMYGEDFVEWLTDTKHTVVKWDRTSLTAYISSLQQKIKLQETRLL